MARRAGRRNPVERLLQPQRQHRLIFGVRKPRDDKRHRLENRLDDHRIVFAVGVGRDERAHVKEAIGLAGRIAVDNPQIGSDRLTGIKRDGQREEQAARRGLHGRMRERHVLLDEVFDGPAAVEQRLRHMHPDLAGAVARLQTLDPL